MIRVPAHLWTLGALVAAVIASSCGDTGADHTDKSAVKASPSEPEPTGDPSRIAVSPSVRSNLGIRFVTVERRRVEQTRRLPGRFEYLPSARREYRTMLPGRIELLVRQFERVEAGQPLFRVAAPAWNELQQRGLRHESTIEGIETELQSFEPLDAAHREHEAKLQASIEVLKGRAEQLKELVGAGGGRVTELSDAQATLARELAALAAAKEEAAQLRAAKKTNEVRLRGERTAKEGLLREMSTLLDLDVRALDESVDASGGAEPLWKSLDTLVVTAAAPGVVEELALTNGAWADERALAIQVVRPELLRFRAMGLQSDLGALSDGLRARIVPPTPTNADRAIGIQDTMQGTVTLGLSADPDSRTVELFVAPDSLSSWARPGVTAQLEITTDASAAEELAVPLAAVQQDGLEAVLFRRNPKNPNEVIRIEGDLGVNDGRWVAVRSGLRDGDEVVLDGSFQLMLASSGSMQKGGHFHSDGTFHEGED